MAFERIVQEGAQKVLHATVEAEVEEHLARYELLRDRQEGEQSGGQQRPRTRAHDPHRSRAGCSAPPAGRRTRCKCKRPARAVHESDPASVPVLDPHPARAVAAILGKKAAGLSATTIRRLKRDWEKKYEQSRKRPPGSAEYACLWADRLYYCPPGSFAVVHPGGHRGATNEREGVAGRSGRISAERAELEEGAAAGAEGPV